MTELPPAKIENGRVLPRRADVATPPLRWRTLALALALTLAAVGGAWYWAWHHIIDGGQDAAESIGSATRGVR